MLLGSAMTAAVAASLQPSLAAGRGRDEPQRRHAGSPTRRKRAGFDRDYRAFLLMHEQRREGASMQPS